jgi:hypothetical protein
MSIPGEGQERILPRRGLRHGPREAPARTLACAPLASARVARTFVIVGQSTH